MRTAVAALGIFTSSFAFGSSLVRQLPGANAESGFFAANTADQTFQSRAADDFDIAGGPITAIAWWGRNSSSAVHDLSNIASIDIAIVGHGLTYPDTSQIYFHQTVALTALSIVATGASGINGNLQFRFELTVDSLALDPGRYWLIIGGNLKVPHTDTLVWNSSPEGNANMASFAYPLDSWSAFRTDLAFEIIPAPSAAALAAFALPCCLRRQRLRHACARIA
ncbi:MAG: hypothetical protein KF805_06440 [Phycisphaeraceae bacterium]|nr:hypothetical protein [Phycisphaeraceae bacterium]